MAPSGANSKLESKTDTNGLASSAGFEFRVILFHQSERVGPLNPTQIGIRLAGRQTRRQGQPATLATHDAIGSERNSRRPASQFAFGARVTSRQLWAEMQPLKWMEPTQSLSVGEIEHL